MSEDGADLVARYRDGFADRLAAMRRPGQELIEEPGILGLVGRDDQALDGRVLVLDDRAVPLLEHRLPELNARVVYAFDTARASHRVLAASAAHRASPCTAMVRDRLGEIAVPPMPAGLVLRPVALDGAGSDEPGADQQSVPIEAAAHAALLSEADAAPITDLDGFLAYLRSIPRARYLAATDADGEVRATAAVATWGTTCGVFFVNTDPGWRGQGVGAAMTAVALRRAAEDGARRACLDASALGLSVYRRLGFESAGPITQFVHR